MAIQNLDRTKWRSYFDQVSQSLRGKPVEIQIVGTHLGDQIQGEKLPLTGLTYDEKDDIFEVVTESIDHMVKKPKAVYIDIDGNQLRSIEVIDAEDNKQIVVFNEWISLESPTN
jgi:hypothetical protein